VQFWSLQGLTDYEKARELQLQLVDLRASDLIPDTVLFLEHPPVITRGRGLQYTGEPRPRHMPLPIELPEGIRFYEAERGGDLTYHGPGQWVVYPICKLNQSVQGSTRDVVGFVRKLESVFIEELAEWGLQGESRAHATGVWIGGRKVASLGIAVRKWIIYHGMAVNCVNDLSPFQLISPCGFSPDVMARLLDFTVPEWFQDADKQWGSCRKRFEVNFARRMARAFTASVEIQSFPDVESALSKYLELKKPDATLVG